MYTCNVCQFSLPENRNYPLQSFKIYSLIWDITEYFFLKRFHDEFELCVKWIEERTLSFIYNKNSQRRINSFRLSNLYYSYSVEIIHMQGDLFRNSKIFLVVAPSYWVSVLSLSTVISSLIWWESPRAGKLSMPRPIFKISVHVMSLGLICIYREMNGKNE